MPSFVGTLTQQQMNLIAAFVSTATGGGVD
jgi:hypothetical protein